jgi:secondary thiamine-phosphate synthase enzyme
LPFLSECLIYHTIAKLNVAFEETSRFVKGDFMTWTQHEIRLPAFSRGFHLITDRVYEAVPEIRDLQIGLLHVFIMHTSASISINENADPDVPRDLELAFNEIAREDFAYQHTLEGPDDMPAHVKSSMIGSSISVPISNGQLCMGTWQGIYLCEHRDRGGSRRLMATVQGQEQH